MKQRDIFEEYRAANDAVKAPRGALEKIKSRMENAKGDKAKASGGAGAFLADRRLLIKGFAAATAVCLLAACIFALPEGTGKNGDKSVTVDYPAKPSEQVLNASSYDDIYELVSSIQTARDEYYYAYNGVMYGAMDDGMAADTVTVEAQSEKNEAALGSSMPTSAPESGDTSAGGGEQKYSDTNVQVQGVDEGDIIKTDGEYIYRLSENKVYIIRAQDMKMMTVLTLHAQNETQDGYKTETFACEMYVSGNRLAVISERNKWQEKQTETTDTAADCIYIGYYYDVDTDTVLSVYDISDRSAPVLAGEMSQSGTYRSSRRIADKLYIISNKVFWQEAEQNDPQTYVPAVMYGEDVCTLPANDICLFDDEGAGDSVTYTVLSCADLDDAKQYDSVKAAFGSTSTVYSNTKNILLAANRTEYSSEETVEDGKNVQINKSWVYTRIMLFDIDNGKITERASGEVSGRLLNQFSVDAHNGYWRLVTTSESNTEKIYTDGVDEYVWETVQRNGVYVLDNGLNCVGRLENIAPTERVYSVRFDGDIAYFVTFRQVDPLFAVDLSDPTRPTILSQLKIPGFSQYMHKYGDGLLFGLGMDADEETGRTKGMKLSMFDISDPENVTEKHTLKIDSTWSEALSNHKAIIVSPQENIIAFPCEYGFLMYGYDSDKGFYEKGEFRFEDEWYASLRGLFIGDNLYICSERWLVKYDMETCRKISSVELV